MILYLSRFRNFLNLARCLVYEHLKSLFLAPLMSLKILLFSCESYLFATEALVLKR